MQMLLLLAALCGATDAAPADMVARLEGEYEQLASAERDPAKIREAAKLLAETNQNTRWTNYAQAVRLIRQSRSKAGIPLLLEYLIKHASFSSAHIYIPEYTDTLVILTGRDFPIGPPRGRDRETAVRQAVQKVVEEWWEPQQKTISTDLGAMSSQELARVTACLLSKSEEKRRYHKGSDEVTAYHLASELEHLSRPQQELPTSWCEEDLHPALLKPLLMTVGWQDMGSKQQEMVSLDLTAVSMLTALRRNGQAEVLEEIAAEKKQPASARLACLLALHGAGERIATAELASVMADSKALQVRILAVMALQYGQERGPALRKLLEMMDDRNREVCTAAVWALRGVPSPEAVDKLKGVIDHLEPAEAVLPALIALGKIEGMESGDALATFMMAAMEDPAKAKHLGRALQAFRSATGWSRRIPAGARASFQEPAWEAIRWWNVQSVTPK